MSVRAARLGEVASFIRGITFKPEDVLEMPSHESVVCFRTKNVQLDLDTADLLHLPSGFVRREEQFVHGGDMLVSSANSWNLVGKTAWVPELSYRATAGGFISILRPRTDAIYPRYLYHWITDPTTQAKLRSCGRQTTNISNLDFNRALELTLPLPCLDEQEHIASILDKADLIRRKRQQALRLTDDFLRSVFLDMFGDLMTNPLGWPIKPLSDGVVEFEGGRNVMPTETPRADGVRVLKVSAVTSGEYKPDESKSFDQTEEFPAHYIVREGDLLISRANTSELVGAVAYVWKTKGKEMLPDKLWRFIWPEERTIEPLFMLHLARSRYFREQLIQRATGSSGSMKNIGKAKMLEIPIPFPPIDLQRTFSRIAMRSRLASESSVASMKQAETLFSSLQQRAFSGEL